MVYQKWVQVEKRYPLLGSEPCWLKIGRLENAWFSWVIEAT